MILQDEDGGQPTSGILCVILIDLSIALADDSSDPYEIFPDDIITNVGFVLV